MTKTIGLQESVWKKLTERKLNYNHSSMNTLISYLLYIDDKDTFKVKEEGETNVTVKQIS